MAHTPTRPPRGQVISFMVGRTWGASPHNLMGTSVNSVWMVVIGGRLMVISRAHTPIFRVGALAGVLAVAVSGVMVRMVMVRMMVSPVVSPPWWGMIFVGTVVIIIIFMMSVLMLMGMSANSWPTTSSVFVNTLHPLTAFPSQPQHESLRNKRPVNSQTQFYVNVDVSVLHDKSSHSAGICSSQFTSIRSSSPLSQSNHHHLDLQLLSSGKIRATDNSQRI